MDSQLTNLIESTLKQIARDYQPGTLPYTKKTKAPEWAKLLAMEQKINEAALKEDPRGLKNALDSYQKLIITLVKKFNQRPEKT